MKKTTNVIALLFVAAMLTLGFESCGKYEEGPSVSLQTKKGRISREWKVEKHIDGDTGDESVPIIDENITFTKDGAYTWESSVVKFNATWKFSSNKEDLIIESTVLGLTSSTTTKILRLTSKELWTIDSDNDETHLVAK